MTLIDARNLHLINVPVVYGTEVVLMTAWGGLEVYMGSNGYWRTLDNSLTIHY